MGEVDFSLSVSQNNTLILAFTSPIINSEYSQILKEIELRVTGPRDDYNATILSSTPSLNQDGKIESIEMPLLIENTIRRKEDVMIEASILSNSERIYRTAYLQPQDPPQFKSTLNLYTQILELT